LETHARALRATVQLWTGIPVSVGIATTKTLAKVANRFAKKDAAGVFVMLDQRDIDEALYRMVLTDLWGVAGPIAQQLTDLGIFHAHPRVANSHETSVF
jgi:DNA polymerase V